MNSWGWDCSNKRMRNFRVEVFKHRVAVDPKHAEDTWKILEQPIHQIYDHNNCCILTHSLEDLYWNAYNMVVHEFGEMLYSGLVSTMTMHLQQIAASVKASQGPLFLEELNKKWMEHNEALHTLRNIFMYMDRTYIPSTHKTPIHELGRNLWRDNIIRSTDIQTRLQVTLLEIMQKERNGEVFNRGLMRNIVKMLVDLGPSVYQQVFEQPFLDVSASFYRGESQQFIECCDCGEYLKKVEKRLNEEIDLVAHYLDAKCDVKITNVVEKEMIESQMNCLVHMENSGLVNMIMEDKYGDLTWIYNFFGRLPNGLTLLRDVMSSHVRETGKKLVIDPERVKDPVEFLQRVLEEKRKHDKIINLAFNNDKTFQNALNSSFEYFINLNRRTQQFISLFVDDKLREGLKGMSEDDFSILDKALMLLSYVQDKVVFENYYMENSVLVNMIVNDNYDDLAQIYNLFHSLQNGSTLIRNVMTSHILETGKQLVIDPKRFKDPVEFVQRVLEEKHKYDKIISLAFNNDKTFQNALNSSFEYFINLNRRTREFIVLFVDEKLRKGLQGMSEEDVEVALDKVITLLRYVQEKDVFEKYYKQHLAKRLLSGISVSEDAERHLILNLKTECGYQFTSKVEGMLTDMKTSQDIMQGFYNSIGPMSADGPTLKVHVLTTGSWPTQPTTTTCNLPPEILTMCDKFKTYYLGTHNGRRLTWQTNMGSADIKATFPGGQKHELNVSTYQMCVLMLFNYADRLSYREIEQAVEIPTVELRQCLQSLACAKGKNALRKEPMSEDVSEDDEFFFNEKFSSEFYKLKIGMVVAQKESEHEKQETRQRVEEDRKPQIDAAIVRMMKAARVSDHNNIVAEVTKQPQLRFLPNPVVIKKRIELLIEREFLERDGGDRKLYRYLA